MANLSLQFGITFLAIDNSSCRGAYKWIRKRKIECIYLPGLEIPLVIHQAPGLKVRVPLGMLAFLGASERGPSLRSEALRGVAPRLLLHAKRHERGRPRRGRDREASGEPGRQ
jgi:hypothetical protein